MMEVWGVWLVALGVIVAGAAAAFAWVQAHAAVETLKDARKARDSAKASAEESARLAGEANAAFIRQAEAQEEANRIKLAELEPDDWSAPKHVTGNVWRISNTSRRALTVESYVVTPVTTQAMVRIRSHHDDQRYEYGDSFDVVVLSAGGLSPEKLTITYQREDDPADGFRKLHVGL